MAQDLEKRLKRAGEKAGFGPLPVVAIVFNLETDEEVARHRFDFNDLEKRLWFIEKVQVWAIFNKHSVELLAQADDD